MNKPLLIILFCILPGLLQARNYTRNERAKHDSLLLRSHLLQNTSDDTNKVPLLTAIANMYFSVDKSDSALQCVNEAMMLSRRLHYRRGEGMAYLALGMLHGYRSYTTDLEHIFKALKIFEETGDLYNTGNALDALGGTYYTMAKFDQALEYFKRLRDIAVRLGDTTRVARTDHSIGGTYLELRDYKHALDHELHSLHHYQRIGDRHMIVSVFGNLASIYSGMKEYNKALVYAFASLRGVDSNLYHTYTYAIIKHDIGYIYLTMARDSVTLIRADSLVPADRSARLQMAVDLLKGGYDIFAEIDFFPLSTLIDYSDALELTGHPTEALAIYRQYAHLKDSTLGSSVEVSIARQETRRESDLKEKQLELNALAAKQKRIERWVLGSGLIMFAMITGFAYRSYKSQRRVNMLQQEALTQKEVLMKEIHHRVKNNLQVISTLLDLQLVNITDEQAKDAITESNTRLRAISLIHQQLYQDDHITTIEFSQFAADLHKQLSGIFSKPGQRVTLTNNIPAGVLDIDTAVPLGMILNELMTNSYKYAFGGGDGQMDIYTEKAGDHYKLVYHDSGPGVAGELDARASKSLGMRIIYRLSKQLAGVFAYEKEKNNFVVTFKDAATRKLVD